MAVLRSVVSSSPRAARAAQCACRRTAINATPALRRRRVNPRRARAPAEVAVRAEQQPGGGPAEAEAEAKARAEAAFAAVPLRAVDEVVGVRAPGVYCVHDAGGAVRYIGMSKSCGDAVGAHLARLGGEVVHRVQVVTQVNDGSGGGPRGMRNKSEMQQLWQAWVQEYARLHNAVPPGNVKPGSDEWTNAGAARSAGAGAGAGPARAGGMKMAKVTSGKGIEDLSVPVADLIDGIVRAEPVVAFIKGEASSPACGFSMQMVADLRSLDAPCVAVNVLDEVYNPGVREAVKEYAQWPTIPQLYIGGEFFGGSDIVHQSLADGSLSGRLSEVLGEKTKAAAETPE